MNARPDERGREARLEPELARLARLSGVALAHVGADGQTRHASRASVVAVLDALGVDGARPAEALAELHRAAWSTPLPPVLVAWDRRPIRLALRVPKAAAEGVLEVALEPREPLPGEPADTVRARFDLATLPRDRGAVIGGVEHVRVRLELPAPSGFGEHELVVACSAFESRALVLAAPEQAAAPQADAAREWGLFLPLHALRTRDDWGTGDLGGLAELCDWAGALGAAFVGTLPLDAVPPDALASPYTPSTRRAWNELHLDLAAAPELARSARARERLASSGFVAERARLRAAHLVEHAAVARAKRAVLEDLHGALTEARRAALARFLTLHPVIERYARFRAVLERQRRPWRAWPERACNGRLEETDHDPRVADLFGYAQMLAAEGLDALRTGADRAALYLDLPVGVHPDGFDVWSERAAFLDGVSVGAPPDAFFAAGQDWGLPAPDVARGRVASLRYFGACLRHHLDAARWLRIDHVAGLNRLWTIPRGASAADGVYLRQPADERWALVCLEARRAGATIVGEDLGTVPAGVRERLARHGMLGMHVLPFEVDPEREPALRTPLRDSLASLGTHDTPTFRGYWSGADLVERGAAPEEHAARARQRAGLTRELVRGGWLAPEEESEPEALLRAALLALAESPARAVVVGIEDLLLEAEPQNRPGTLHAENWRRRCRFTLEELRSQAWFAELLRAVGRARERHGS